MCSKQRPVTVLDGGFATQLSTHVAEPVDGTPLWSAAFLATNPEAVVKTHLDFLRAGAQIITTNTYQASLGGFMEHLGLSKEESAQLIRTAVDLAKQAVAIFTEKRDTQKDISKPLIAGSVGPYGAALHDGSEYNGNYVETVTKEKLIEWHRPRIQLLVDAGVDLLAIETIPAQFEGEVLAELLKEFHQQKAWISFSCKDYHHLSHGELFQEAASSCVKHNPEQLVAIGTNCVNPEYVSSLFKNANIPIPLIVYPNSGEMFDVEKGWYGGNNMKHISSYIPEWLDLGVRYVGGCCRTYPEDIKSISEVVDKWTQKFNHSEGGIL